MFLSRGVHTAICTDKTETKHKPFDVYRFPVNTKMSLETQILCHEFGECRHGIISILSPIYRKFVGNEKVVILSAWCKPDITI